MLLAWGDGLAAQGRDVDCGAAATQSALNMCAAAAQAAAEAEMARAYEALEMRLSAEGRAALGEAQGAWEVFRRQHCAFVAGGVAGGSVAPMIYSQCARAQSAARTRELSALMVCAEGDLACPR
ncbi:MAG: lysozyme inhibitor LprI family protein [Polymorphobacter sp.]|uniref:lysozyme inhibitor LprI family protein n=1 Tax=Polymorphobacter sp. TaxID=1909290 RepID=UPI003A896249